MLLQWCVCPMPGQKPLQKKRERSNVSATFGKVWAAFWLIPGRCRTMLFNFCPLQDSICHILGLGHQCIQKISKEQSKRNEIGLMPVLQWLKGMSYRANTKIKCWELPRDNVQHGKWEGWLLHSLFTSRANGIGTDQAVCLTWSLSAWCVY